MNLKTTLMCGTAKCRYSMTRTLLEHITGKSFHIASSQLNILKHIDNTFHLMMNKDEYNFMTSTHSIICVLTLLSF